MTGYRVVCSYVYVNVICLQHTNRLHFNVYALCTLFKITYCFNVESKLSNCIRELKQTILCFPLRINCSCSPLRFGFRVFVRLFYLQNSNVVTYIKLNP